MATYSRVSPDGWGQGDDASGFSRVTPDGWEQIAAAGGVSGTSSTTNAADTSSASGSPIVNGTLSRTNAADTSAASGSPVATGSSATTNAADTSAASGSVGGGVSGTSATTNANDTPSASGTPVVNGALARTNAADTSVASGSAGSVSGTVAATNANDSASAAGISFGSADGFQGTGGAFFPLKANKKRETAAEKRARRIAQGIEKPDDPAPVVAEPAPKRPSDLSPLRQDKAAAEFVATLKAQQDMQRAIERVTRQKAEQAEEEDIVFIAAMLSL